jgi:putative membrane protein
MQKPTWRLLAAATLSAPLLAGCGTRDERATNDSAGGTVAMTDSTGMSTTGTMNETATGAMDASLVSFVAKVNQSEIEVGRLASTKARSTDVKNYAGDMVKGHQEAMDELRDLSGRSGWTLPDAGSGGAAAQGGEAMTATMTQLQQSHEQAMTRLRTATGAAFDRAYMDNQVAAHQQTLDILRQHATSVQNNDLRAKINDMQKDVEEHLRRAQEIAQKLGGERS